MLTFLVSSTEKLAELAVLLGLMMAHARSSYDLRGRRIVLIGALTGLVAAGVMAYLKNKTKLIDTGAWNLRLFAVSIALIVLLCIFDSKWLRRLGQKQRWILYVPPVLAALLLCDVIFYTLPDVLAYPYTIVLSGSAVFSSAFIVRIIGVILGGGLAVLSMLAVRRVCLYLKPGVSGFLFKLAYIVAAAEHLYKLLTLLYSARIITARWIFKIIKYCSNHSGLFTYIILVIAVVVPVIMWVRSFRVKEPYENPAQHRKIRANWRSIRRWSVTVVVCFVLVVINMTAVKAYNERPVALSETEDCELIDDELYVPFEQVNDGNLHRFAYTTDNGVSVRFIIIKKPNSSAYGVGLDACDICGETGYYQRGTQVICNRCDVVMNINTIGFKGGCNPKVIDYRIEDGYIIVPTSTLVEHEKDFK